MTGADRLEAVVHGRVHGVGFRVFVVREARRLGLTGWVANQAGGTLRCIAEGQRADLAMLLRALHEGPAGARIERVDASWTPATGEFAAFDVRSGWHGGD